MRSGYPLVEVRRDGEAACAKGGAGTDVHRRRARPAPQAKVFVSNVGRESEAGDQPCRSSPQEMHRICRGPIGEGPECYTDEEVRRREEKHHAQTSTSDRGMHACGT